MLSLKLNSMYTSALIATCTLSFLDRLPVETGRRRRGGHRRRKKILRADVEKYYQNQTAGTTSSPWEASHQLAFEHPCQLIDDEILMRRREARPASYR